LGTYFFDDANSLKQDSLVLVNTRIGYEFGKSGLYLFANNLFDREYFTAAFAPLGSPRANYGDRRTIGIQFQTKF
jgi:iron complex outermembrane receptor protein